MPLDMEQGREAVEAGGHVNEPLKPLMELVRVMREMEQAHRRNYAKEPSELLFMAHANECKEWADELEAQLRAWDEALVQDGFDPTRWPDYIRVQLLGVPPK